MKPGCMLVSRPINKGIAGGQRKNPWSPKKESRMLEIAERYSG